MKQKWILCVVCALLVMITGCDKGREEHYTKEEALSYLKDAYDETFTYVSEDKVNNEIIYTFTPEKRKNLQVQVTSHKASGWLFGCAGSGCEYILDDDYKDVSIKWELEQQKQNLLSEQAYVDESNTSIYMMYTAYHEIENKVDYAKRIYTQVNEGLPKGANIPVKLQYEKDAFKHLFPDVYIMREDLDTKITSEEIQTAYVQKIVQYRLEDTSIPNSKLSEARDKTQEVHIQYHDSYKRYTLSGSKDVTYGILFEIFQEIEYNEHLGYGIAGTNQDYTITNNGDIYHFSYDFYDKDGSYYLENDVKIPTNDFTVNKVAGISISSLTDNVCIINDAGGKTSICFDQKDQQYVLKVGSNITTAYHFVAGLDYVIEYPSNCSGICLDEDKENYKKYQKLEKDFGSSLVSYTVYEIDGNTYIIDDEFADKKGLYYYFNNEKTYLPNSKEYLSLENMEELFSCTITYHENTNTFTMQRK